MKWSSFSKNAGRFTTKLSKKQKKQKRHWDRQYTFGVSGRLYKSNVLLYDHQTESLWFHLMEKAITVKLVDKRLKRVPSSRTKWRTWKKKNPDTMVLSTNTGFNRDYGRDPYEGYYRVGTIWFPVRDACKDLAPKEMILGIDLGGESNAYPLVQLIKQPGTLKDSVGGFSLEIEVSTEGEVVSITDHGGKAVPHIFSYWFAWQAFHPETKVFKNPR
jgi:hypothetical protein